MVVHDALNTVCSSGVIASAEEVMRVTEEDPGCRITVVTATGSVAEEAEPEIGASLSWRWALSFSLTLFSSALERMSTVVVKEVAPAAMSFGRNLFVFCMGDRGDLGMKETRGGAGYCSTRVRRQETR